MGIHVTVRAPCTYMQMRPQVLQQGKQGSRPLLLVIVLATANLKRRLRMFLNLHHCNFLITFICFFSPCYKFHGNTTLVQTVCASTHLTLFSSSWAVPPNTIDFSTVFDNLDQKLVENIHVVVTVIGLAVIFVVVAVFLRRKDKQDLAKVS